MGAFPPPRVTSYPSLRSITPTPPWSSRVRSSPSYATKVHFVQELNDDDFDRRIEFYELMTKRIDEDCNFLSNIVFF